MRTKSPYPILVAALVALLQPATMIAQASSRSLNPAYLGQMPHPERVKAELKGSTAKETALLQIGAFYQLQEVIRTLAGPRAHRNQLTPDEIRVMQIYEEASFLISQAIEKTLATEQEKRKWRNDSPFEYRFDRSDRRFGVEGTQLFARFLSEDLRTRFAAAIGVEQERHRAFVQAQNQTQPKVQGGSSGGTQPHKPEEQTVQAMLDGLVKATADLLGTLSSQVQTTQPSTSPPVRSTSVATEQDCVMDAYLIAACGVSMPKGDGPTVKLSREQANAVGDYFQQGKKYAEAKQYGEAIESYKRILAISPIFVVVRLRIADAYFSLKKYPEAVAELKESIRIDPKNVSADTYLLLGLAYKSMEQHENAVAALRESVRLKPDRAFGWASLGFSYYYLKKDSEAIPAFQQAIRLDPKYAYAYRGLGFAYVGLGKKEEAQQVYKTLLGIDKSEADKIFQSISEMSTPKSSALPATNAASQPVENAKPPASASAQCPDLSVSSPTEVQNGRPIGFTVTASGGNRIADPTYNWNVSAGTISSGQGTSSITVDTTGIGGLTLTATVDVTGYPRRCRTSQSGITSIRSPRPLSRKFDLYSSISLRDHKDRLDNFAIAMQNDPMARGYVIAYGGRNTPSGTAAALLRTAQTHLIETRGIESDRVVAINGGYREEPTVELWIVPSGAQPPQASPTVDPSNIGQPPTRKPATTNSHS